MPAPPIEGPRRLDCVDSTRTAVARRDPGARSSTDTEASHENVMPDTRRVFLLLTVPSFVVFWLIVSLQVADAGRRRGPVCGNGLVQPGEQCDDGNTEPGDLCSPACTLEVPADCIEVTSIDYQNAFLMEPVFARCRSGRRAWATTRTR